MALTLTDAARNAMADAFADLADAGTTDAGADLVIRDSGNVELAVFVLDDPAFSAAGATNPGQVDVLGTPKTVSASATGTAENALVRDQDNTNIVTGLTVGTSGTDVVIDNTSIESGQDVTLNSGQFTMPAS